MKRSLVQAGLLTGLCITLALATVLLTGCNTLANLNIQNPRYSIRDIRPRIAIALPLSASAIDFDLTVGVDNPNNVALRLDHLDFSLFVNESRLLDSVTNERVRIPANGIGDVHLRARVNYDNIRSIWSEVLGALQGNRARYEVRGNAYFDTPVGQLRFPVNAFHASR